MKKFKYAYVITGSIASGKSSIMNLLSTNNYKTIIVDKITHRILDENIDLIKQNFGEEFILNNAVDRKKLGKLVFNNKEKLKLLENLIQGKIIKAMLEKCEEYEILALPYFVEMPLLFELNLEHKFQNIIVIEINFQENLKRLMQRDNLNLQEAKNRLNLNLPLEEKLQKASFVIQNNDNIENLELQIKKIINFVKENNENK